MSTVTPRRVAPLETASPRLLELLPSFRRHLAAENKAPRTLQAYSEAVSRLHDYQTATGMPTAVDSITRDHIEAFMADQLDRLKASSARSRYASLRQFFRWCQNEGEIRESPMARMRPPAVPEQPVPILGEEELRTLVRATERDTTMQGRRDAALIRVFIDSGARLAEVAALTIEDMNLESGTVRLMGKGRRARINPIGSRLSVRSIDTYGSAPVIPSIPARPSGSGATER